MGDQKLPAVECWHCGFKLDAISPMDDSDVVAKPGAISLCMYCGIVGIIGPDMKLIPPSKEVLDNLELDSEFRSMFSFFQWSRNQVAIRVGSLMRDKH
jgi:hypothetical protein